MSLPVLALLLLLGQNKAVTATGSSAAPAEEDVIVVARPDNRCVLRYADKTMTDAELHAHARIWASGTPVRVMARSHADLSCLKKIAFRLASQGVTRIEFVDPSGKPADIIPDASPPPRINDHPAMSGKSGGDVDSVRQSEHNFIAHRAARLIREGDCAGARKLALQAEDLDTAAEVSRVCGGQ